MSADVILLLTRREKVMIDEGEPSSASAQADYYDELKSDAVKDKLEVIVAKNKGGPLGSIKLNCFLKYDIITELADEDGEGFTDELTF